MAMPTMQHGIAGHKKQTQCNLFCKNKCVILWGCNKHFYSRLLGILWQYRNRTWCSPIISHHFHHRNVALVHKLLQSRTTDFCVLFVLNQKHITECKIWIMIHFQTLKTYFVNFNAS